MFKVGRRGDNHRQATLDRVPANIGRPRLWRQDDQWCLSPCLGYNGLENSSIFIPPLLVVTRNIVQILLCFHLHVSVHGWGLMRFVTLSWGGDTGRVMESVYLILRQTQGAGPGLHHWHVGEGFGELLLRRSLAIAGPKFKSELKRYPMSPSIKWLTDLR